MTQHPSTDQLSKAQACLMNGDKAGARSLLSGILRDVPDHTEALYMCAVLERYEGQFDAAQKALNTLLAKAPELGRAWQEAGHLARARNDRLIAQRAYSAAVRFNPALEASWQYLQDLQTADGQIALAQQSAAQIKRLKALPKALLAVTHHLYEGRILKAEDVCRAFLKKNPDHSEAMRLLADIAVRMGVYDDAEILLENAVRFDPDTVQIRLDYIQLLRKRQRYGKSLDQSEALLNRDRNNPTFLSNVAIDKMHVGAFEDAVQTFDQVLALVPGDPTTLTSKGHALKTWGDQKAAVASYRGALQQKADHGDAWYGLANLKTYVFDETDRRKMHAALQDPVLLPGDRTHIAFALAKAEEDAGNHKAAFDVLALGNDLKKRASRYDADQMQAELAAQARVADKNFLARARNNGGCPAPDPIFIVGLPRAGSTLLEQILASHSQIDGTLELPHILSTAHSLRGKIGNNRYPDALLDLSDEEARTLGEAYLEETKPYREAAPYFTDKMPNNFRHIGLIARILPNAKIIDARRSAMDCCFSAYKQLFAEGQEFTYDLTDVGRYYRDYVALMDHFDQAQPGLVLRVHYEDVVKNLEAQVRRILAFLGLPFEEACIQFHETERAVRTASSEQVRQKINTKGLGAWKPYDAWLDPLKQALGPLATTEEPNGTTNGAKE